MHPDQRRLQLLNDLIAQTLDVITQQRNITGGFSHSPYQMTPMQQQFFDPNRQQWSTQPQYGFGTQAPQYTSQMSMGQRLPHPQMGYGQPMVPSGFGHSPYQQTMMDPFQLQMLRQQQNLPWQQVPTSVYGQTIPNVVPTTEQQWDPRGFSHTPYQTFDPLKQQRDIQLQMLKMQQQNLPWQQVPTSVYGQTIPNVVPTTEQQWDPRGFSHTPYTVDPLKQQRDIQLQMLKMQQQNLPWQQVPTSVYGQTIPGVFPTIEQQWDPRGFSHTPYQGVDPLTQQREMLESAWNQQRQISSSPVTGQMGPMFYQQPDPQGFFHSSGESMDPMRRQQGFFQGNLTGQYPMNVPLTSIDPNIVR
jgi:hypothetical protein